MVHTRGRLCDHGITVPECPAVSPWELSFALALVVVWLWVWIGRGIFAIGILSFPEEPAGLGKRGKSRLGVVRC